MASRRREHRARVLTAGAIAVAFAATMGALAGPASAGDPAALSAASLRPSAGPPPGHAQPAATVPQISDQTPSPWTPLVNQPSFDPGTMLLESDGTVLVHDEPETGFSGAWYKLTPSSTGSYIDGTWSKIASLPFGYQPEYFASAILPNGEMIVEGGEYNNSDNPLWTDRGAIYNPLTNFWTPVAPPAGWTSIGDAQSDVLANGTFMLAQPCQSCVLPSGALTTDDALFNADTDTWLVIPGEGKNDPNDEEGWTLEPSGQLLTVDAWLTPTTELFTPQSLTWSSAGNTVGSPVDTQSVEVGPQVEMPGGNTFVVGAGSGPAAPAPCTTKTPAETALYHYLAGTPGTWTAGPRIPTTGGEQYDSADGPGSILPDGSVLFDVSPCAYNAPILFYLYNPTTNRLTPVPDVPNAANDSSYYTRMLALPNGQILFNDDSQDMEVYTAGGTPQASWAPTITSLSSTTLVPGLTYHLGGSQLAGLDQGAAYGDDVQDNTNFPLVQITNVASGAVTYARTFGWSSVSVAPGALSTTNFTLPLSTPAGASNLVVIANGIASSPVSVTVP